MLELVRHLLRAGHAEIVRLVERHVPSVPQHGANLVFRLRHVAGIRHRPNQVLIVHRQMLFVSAVRHQDRPVCGLVFY